VQNHSGSLVDGMGNSIDTIIGTTFLTSSTIASTASYYKGAPFLNYYSASAGDTYIVAGVVRNEVGTGWYLITSGHSSLNVAYVTSSLGVSSQLIIGYPTSSLPISFIIAPDEVYSSQKIICGASVGVNQANIQFYSANSIAGRTRYRTAGGWTDLPQNVIFLSSSFSNGLLTISHSTALLGASGLGIAVSSGQYNVGINADPTSTSFVIAVKDYTGSLVNSVANNSYFYYNRDDSGQISANSLVDSSGNFWFYGLFVK
jgi:hypothetical protein